ncbi:MAG: CRISPR-associated endonuclease Cas2 [Candidatus Kerfeldbacteria bacterium]|nr:CRISPR-associated endonuclease Cas2 [Candidatus Kerfeldbacteria bacterium]
MKKRAYATKVLLTVLSDLGQVTVDLKDLATALATGYGSAFRRGGKAYVAELKRLQQRSVLRTTVRQLRHNKYVIARQTGNRFLIKLTQKGWATTLIHRLRQAKPQAQGLYTVVIFDIPETERLSRQQLRLLLRQGGFTKLQQSVWVSKSDTYEVIVEFVRQAKLERWVNVLRSTDFFRQPHSTL